MGFDSKITSIKDVPRVISLGDNLKDVMVNKNGGYLFGLGTVSNCLHLTGKKRIFYQLIFFGLVFGLISIGMAVRSVLRIE